MDENNNLEMVMGEQTAVVTPVVDTKKISQYAAIASGVAIGAGALYLLYRFVAKPAIAKMKANKADVTPIAEKPEEEKKEEK